jgi:hypothetical protein
MKFRANVIPSGNATAVDVPRKVVEGLDSGPRPLIAVTINGHTWFTPVAHRSTNDAVAGSPVELA